MIELLYLLFLVLLSIGIGKGALKALKVDFNGLEEAVFAFPLGLAVLGYLCFGIGLSGYLYKEVVGGVFIVLFAVFFREIKDAVIECSGFFKGKLEKGSWKRRTFDFSALLVVFLVLFALANLASSFAPPRHYDVLAYHLAVPKLYIEHHRIYYIQDIFYSNLPFLIEIIYLIGLLLKNSILANLLAYAMALAFAGAVYCFCRRFFTKGVALLASAVFYSFPLVSRIASTAHIDLQYGMFTFLSLYACMVFFEKKRQNLLVLSGVFGGLGIASKVFGVVAVAGVGMLLMWFVVNGVVRGDIKIRQALVMVAIFCTIMFAVIFPWLAKNYAFTGNPVWPSFNGVFGGEGWDSGHQERLEMLINRREISISNYLLVPWDIHTQMGAERHNIGKGEGIGPYVLAFLPLYPFLKRKNRIINMFFFLILFYVSVWFFLSYFLRYMIVVLPLVAIISAYVIERLLEIGRGFGKIIKALLIFTLCFNLLIVGGMAVKSVPVASGLQSEEEYYSTYVGGVYKASDFVNKNVPENGKILLFRDNRGYFLSKAYLWGDPLFQTEIEYSKIKDGGQLYDVLMEKGVTYVMMNTEFDWEGVVVHEFRYSERILGMMDDMLATYSEKIYDNGEMQVYELKK